MSRCLRCRRREARPDRAYCSWCLDVPDHAVSGYRTTLERSLDDSPDLPDAEIERLFAEAKRDARRKLHVGNGWDQRRCPPVGSRLEDYAPAPGDLPTHHEVVGTPSECPVKRKAARAARKQIAHEWNSGVGR